MSTKGVHCLGGNIAMVTYAANLMIIRESSFLEDPQTSVYGYHSVFVSDEHQ